MTKQEELQKAQEKVRAEICEAHGLDPDQITFADDATPIFDFEAVSLLALKLTDIKSIECATLWLDTDRKYVTAKCDVELPDGRSRSVSATALVGETLAGGQPVNTLFQAEAVAHARATRRGVRSVGINLFRAHRQYMQTGSTTSASGRLDPKIAFYQEAHLLAIKLRLIVGTDRSKYEALIAANFDGRTSTRDLDETELDLFINMLRLKEKNLTGH